MELCGRTLVQLLLLSFLGGTAFGLYMQGWSIQIRRKSTSNGEKLSKKLEKQFKKLEAL